MFHWTVSAVMVSAIVIGPWSVPVRRNVVNKPAGRMIDRTKSVFQFFKFHIIHHKCQTIIYA